MRRLCVLSVAAGAVALAALVGGASGRSASEARYAAAVERWCTGWWERQAALGDPESPAEWAAWLSRRRAFADEQRRELVGLPVPPSYREEAEWLLHHVDVQEPILDRMLAAARQGDAPRLERLRGELRASDRGWSGVMRRIGALDCV